MLKKKQENVITRNFAVINTLATQHKCMNWMIISDIIWKMFGSDHTTWITTQVTAAKSYLILNLIIKGC